MDLVYKKIESYKGTLLALSEKHTLDNISRMCNLPKSHLKKAYKRWYNDPLIKELYYPTTDIINKVKLELPPKPTYKLPELSDEDDISFDEDSSHYVLFENNSTCIDKINDIEDDLNINLIYIFEGIFLCILLLLLIMAIFIL